MKSQSGWFIYNVSENCLNISKAGLRLIEIVGSKSKLYDWWRSIIKSKVQLAGIECGHTCLLCYFEIKIWQRVWDGQAHFCIR